MPFGWVLCYRNILSRIPSEVGRRISWKQLFHSFVCIFPVLILPFLPTLLIYGCSSTRLLTIPTRLHVSGTLYITHPLAPCLQFAFSVLRIPFVLCRLILDVECTLKMYTVPCDLQEEHRNRKTASTLHIHIQTSFNNPNLRLPRSVQSGGSTLWL